jgi:hypothetical protein
VLYRSRAYKKYWFTVNAINFKAKQRVIKRREIKNKNANRFAEVY